MNRRTWIRHAAVLAGGGAAGYLTFASTGAA